MKSIEIIVSPQGEARIETRGYAGAACQDASRLLEAALGVRQSEQLTSAFFQQPVSVPSHLSAGGHTNPS
ncbi:hypothetical protein Pla175_18030 [Pirellulimonas nuda]|uniref:DUF2997 domain-containing protein n=1 Tax=Pirellulimonas nuda TaxID=2528009 RepID=A0A518DAB3_9BACT|nr:DUF2997 domain-containing protein [Pirellulimonas nuda]QDU88425.1 hypothetical protein Pla175_18030 [Pirellulimonas nuda]